MEKKPFVTKEQLEKIVEKYPTPFHLYDEKGIRQTQPIITVIRKMDSGQHQKNIQQIMAVSSVLFL